MDGAGKQSLYARLLHQQKSGFLLVLLLSALTNILTLTGSVYMLQVYDRVIPTGSVVTLFGLLIIAVTLYGFFALFDMLRQRILTRISLRINLDLGEECFRAWIRSGPRKHPNDDEPLLDLGILTKFLSGPLAISVFDLPFVPLFLLFLFFIHPWLGGVVFAALVLSALAAPTATMTVRPMHAAAQRHQHNLHEFSDKSRHAAEALSAMQMQRHAGKRWKVMHDKFLAFSQKTSLPSELLSTVTKTLRALLQTVLLTVGAMLVIRDQITPGMIMAVLILSGRILTPVDHFTTRWREVRHAYISHRKLSRFHNLESTPANHGPAAISKGQITLRKVTVFHPHNVRGLHNPPLQGVSLDIPPGTQLGIIGHSATGKTLLAKVISGAIKPDFGDIFIDGVPLHAFPPEALERAIGYLPQNAALFSATVFDNVSRFDPKATAADVTAAAKLAGAHEAISSLPHGYQTHVGERAEVPLSSGQIQLIGLARCFIFRPQLIILDEPYTHLDTAGICALDEAMVHLKREKRTIIVMSHSRDSFKSMDKILTLQNGRLKNLDRPDQVKSRKHPTRINALPQTLVQTPRKAVIPNLARSPHSPHKQ